MAAYAGVSAHAFWHDGGGIVRTARAEIGRAHRHVLGFGENALRFFQLRHPRGDLLVRSDPLQDTLANTDRDVVGIERAFDGKQPVTLLVFFADAGGLVGSTVKLLANLHFDQRPFLFHHDDEVEAGSEFLQIAFADGPGAGDLVQADAQIVALDLIDTELVERLTHVEIALTHRDDADPRRSP